MIKITTTLQRNLQELADRHCKMLGPSILAKLLLPGVRKRQKEFVDANIKEILTAPANELLPIWEQYKTYCKQPGRAKLTHVKNGLSKIFDYGHFSSKRTPAYNAYYLSRALNVNTCPYCNRAYIHTIEGENSGIIRPDIDHFHPRSGYPLLALSFYNLIPCCLVCNRTLKGRGKLAMNPYEEGFGNDVTFNYLIKNVESGKGSNEQYGVFFDFNEIMPEKTEKCKKNIQLLKLKEIYEAGHGNEIAEIIRKHEISSGTYLQKLHDTFPGLGSVQELYNIAFGNYYREDDHGKRPLAKLTKDIFEQLSFFVIDNYYSIQD